MLNVDATLTHKGLEPSQSSGKLLVIACGALAREIIALVKQNGWSHIELSCLPAILHNYPESIAPSVMEAVEKHRRSYDKIFVAYADCGTGGVLKATCESLGVEMIQGPHCYSFYEGNDVFLKRDEFNSFYLTDFLARQFDAFVWKPLGLDRHPDLVSSYFGNYKKLVYQSQIADPFLVKKAQECADRLGLLFEHRHTGYGDLEIELQRQI